MALAHALAEAKYRGTLFVLAYASHRHLNLGGLIALVIGFLWLNQFRADIIAARTESLQTQAGIIAAAIAASAAVETNTITLDPDKLLQSAPGSGPALAPNDEDSIEFSINPERVGPVLHRLVTPTHTRARIYDRDGLLLLDSQTLSARTRSRARFEARRRTRKFLAATVVGAVRRFFAPAKPPRGVGNWAANGKSIPEVADALAAKVASIVRVNSSGETIVSVAVPVQRSSAVRGALVLSTQGGDIDKVIASERWALLRFFLVILGGDAPAFALAREHDRRARAQARGSGRARPARHQIAPADPRLHKSVR